MSFSRYVVRRCYDLEASAYYKSRKQFFYDLLENPHAPVRPYFDISMILLVLTSVYLLIYDIGHDLGLFGLVFELLAVAVFLTEYLLRLWLYSDTHKIVIHHYEQAEFVGRPFLLWAPMKEVLASKWQYMISPLAVIDLLAIIPAYRPLRFLRIFLLFRLFKLFRYARSASEFVKVLSDKRFELYTLAIFMAFVVFTAAAALYFFETRQDGGQVESIFDGIYWALITISTVGYGDITPQSAEGRVIAMALILSGIGVISFTTSIIVSAFGEKMTEMRINRVFGELEKFKGGHTVLCGFGRMGQVVAEQLARDKMRFVVVDPDSARAELAKKLGYLVIAEQAEKTELLENVGVARLAERVLCLTGSDVANVYITLTARHLNPKIEIISRANREETVRKLVQVGATHTIRPYNTVGLMASEFLGKPVAFEAVNGIISGSHNIGLETVTVRGGGALDGKLVGAVDFAGNKLQLFGVITSDVRTSEGYPVPFDLAARAFYFNPGKEFRLGVGDVLLVFGHELSVVHFKDKLETGRL